ncbi:uncharacterized protein RMCN_4614 [Mycolicibacterium novocastrense]|uniref:Uncharacterized protein n=1 Tax=Mycolicibacterium novocastrense TaxID=59813 RepID=A0ABQ0KQS3_MYCNV|nr:uncharacterized protein RMCN_4614 [Mycolicibacterium novocastrense]
MALETGADRVEVVFEAQQVAIVFEYPACHRRGHAELVAVQPQVSGAAGGPGESGRRRDRGNENQKCQ